jgi:phage portal protein BeeE
LTQQERKEGYYVEFNINSLLRGDAQSRAIAYATGRQWGWLSVNDIRKLENMNSIDNGNIYLEPLNMGEAGKVNDQIKATSEQVFRMIERRE